MVRGLARVGALNHGAQVVDRDAGVDRRRREASMSEQLLDVADGCAAAKEMRGARVSERVRRERGADRAGVGLDHEAHTARLETRAVTRKKERGIEAFREIGARFREVVIESGSGAARDRNDAVLPSLAVPHEEDAFAQVEVRYVRAHGLAEAQAGSVE